MLNTTEDIAKTTDFRGRTAKLNGTPVPWSRIGFLCLPTYAADRFELRVDLEQLGVQVGDTVTFDFSGSDSLDRPVSIVLRGR